jgi:Raf kinase inhibitor-like YbhB/YbcL family protein
LPEIREVVMRRAAVFLVSLITFLFYCQVTAQEGEAMKLTSPEFENNQMMPARFTCEGQDVSPELVIEGIPAGARSLTLIMDDPDAPMGTWVHWVLYNIPVTGSIKENSAPGEAGMTDSGKAKYHGPCPPSGTHRYFFKIYALDAKLGLASEPSKEDVEAAMKGHILAQAELVGLYKRK